jgi:16S rRNA (guanine1207-N2)-methyltransferase
MAELLPALGLHGRVLAVDDDDDLVAPALRRLGLDVVAWHRRALRGHAAQPWLEGEGFEAAFVRYPVSRDAFEMIIHVVAARLAPGGRLFACGANDEGIKGSATALATAFQDVETVETKRHSRVVAAMQRRDVPFKRELEDWRESVTMALPSGSVSLVSYPCLFAHGRLDAGTALLLEALPKELKTGARVLDYGCGIGVVGLAVQTANPSAELDLIDFDSTATHAAKQNVPQARVLTADSLAAVHGKKYDLIVSNPPIHAGKGEDFTVLLRFLAEAAVSLAPGGALLFVVQATVPIKKELTKLFGQVEIAQSNKQFTVWRCSREK